jgi:Domain of unknown function (DUF4365)
MPRKSDTRRKQRTRQHIIDISIHHVEGFVLEAGYTIQRVDKDYGYDLFLFTFDRYGYAEEGLVFLQVKAAESLQLVRKEYVFDLDIRDYNLWIREELPVILILFDATHHRAYWLPIQDYFSEDATRGPQKGAKTVRVRIAATQVLDSNAIATIRELKRTALATKGKKP